MKICMEIPSQRTIHINRKLRDFFLKKIIHIKLIYTKLLHNKKSKITYQMSTQYHYLLELQVAAEEGNLEYIQKFFQKERDQSIPNGFGTQDINKLISNIDVLIDEKTLLMSAAKHRHPSVVELLIQNGANVNLQNSHGNTAICFSTSSGCSASTLLLIKAGADLNVSACDEPPLVCASRLGYYNVVELLIKFGANINAQNKYNGRTALFYSLMFKHLNTMKVLLRHNPDFNIQDSDRRTALMAAHPIAKSILNDFNKLKSLKVSNTYLSVIPNDIIMLIEDIIFDSPQTYKDSNIEFMKLTGRKDDTIIAIMGKVSNIEKWREISPIGIDIEDKTNGCWIVTGRIKLGDYYEIARKEFVISLGIN